MSFGLFAALIIAAAAFAAATFSYRLTKDERRSFTDLLLTPLVPFFLSWKLSLLLTDGTDVLKNPRFLLFSTGGPLNLIIGLSIAVLWLIVFCLRKRPSPRIQRAVLRFAIIAGVLGFLAAVGWRIFFGDSSRGTSSPVSIELTTPEGDIWRASESRGKPVILNFWASWCPPCRAEMPMLADIARDVRFADVDFFAVNAQQTEAREGDGIDWLVKNQIDIPLLFDSDSSASSTLSIQALPTTIILNRQGHIISRKTGAVGRSWIRSGIRKARRTRKSSRAEE